MRTPIFAANWKMHLGPREAREFVAQFVELFPRQADRTVVLFPSAVAIEAVAMGLRGRPDIGTGVQNIWTEPKGAFTGECSAAMAREAGATYALVGHSERRHVFGETNEQTALKCVQAFEAGMTPMLCVGETLIQRTDGKTQDIVIQQLIVGISKLSPEQVLAMPIAYEPVWAIGAGKTATPDDAAEVHAVIKRRLVKAVGARAEACPILYGGSVNEANAASLLAAPGVAGLLVGGASLKPMSWARICQA